MTTIDKIKKTAHELIDKMGDTNKDKAKLLHAIVYDLQSEGCPHKFDKAYTEKECSLTCLYCWLKYIEQKG